MSTVIAKSEPQAWETTACMLWEARGVSYPTLENLNCLDDLLYKLSTGHI
jgi:hypothetical protein